MLYYTQQPPSEAYQRLLQCGTVVTKPCTADASFLSWRKPERDCVEVEQEGVTVFLQLGKTTGWSRQSVRTPHITLTAANDGGTQAQISTVLRRSGVYKLLWLGLTLLTLNLFLLWRWGISGFFWGILSVNLVMASVALLVDEIREYRNWCASIGYVLEMSGFEILLVQP